VLNSGHYRVRHDSKSKCTDRYSTLINHMSYYMLNGLTLMDLSVATELLKTFPSCNLRVFKQFSSFPKECISEKETGYVVFANQSLADDKNYPKLTTYAKTHNLRIDPYGQYLMVSARMQR
jgi:hypothetical protein